MNSSNLFHRFLTLPVEHMLENNASPVSFQNQQTEVCAQGRCQHYPAAATRLLKDKINPELVKTSGHLCLGIGSSSPTGPK